MNQGSPLKPNSHLRSKKKESEAARGEGMAIPSPGKKPKYVEDRNCARHTLFDFAVENTYITIIIYTLSI